MHAYRDDVVGFSSETTPPFCFQQITPAISAAILLGHLGPVYFRKQVFFLLCYPRKLRSMSKGVSKSIFNKWLLYRMKFEIMCKNLCVRMCVCMSVCMHIGMCVCKCMCTCVCECMYVCVNVCECVCISECMS